MAAENNSRIIEITAKSLKRAESLAETHAISVVLPWTQKPQAESARDILVQRAGLQFNLIMVHDDLAAGPAALINQVFERSRSVFFGYLAQDVFPSRRWLAQAAAVLKKTDAGLLAFNDGKWAGQIAAFGLAQRQWVNSIYGGSHLFFSGYTQHYGDVELSLIARQQKRFSYDANAVMMEVDFSKESRTVNTKDRDCFATRKLTGFDGRVKDSELLGLFG